MTRNKIITGIIKIISLVIIIIVLNIAIKIYYFNSKIFISDANNIVSAILDYGSNYGHYPDNKTQILSILCDTKFNRNILFEYGIGVIKTDSISYYYSFGVNKKDDTKNMYNSLLGNNQKINLTAYLYKHYILRQENDDILLLKAYNSRIFSLPAQYFFYKKLNTFQKDDLKKYLRNINNNFFYNYFNLSDKDTSEIAFYGNKAKKYYNIQIKAKKTSGKFKFYYLNGLFCNPKQNEYTNIINNKNYDKLVTDLLLYYKNNKNFFNDTNLDSLIFAVYVKEEWLY